MSIVSIRQSKAEENALKGYLKTELIRSTIDANDQVSSVGAVYVLAVGDADFLIFEVVEVGESGRRVWELATFGAHGVKE